MIKIANEQRNTVKYSQLQHADTFKLTEDSDYIYMKISLGNHFMIMDLSTGYLLDEDSIINLNELIPVICTLTYKKI